MSPRLPLRGLLHLLVIWVVWGSTYLAIRMAVREGAGWGPFWLGFARVIVAGVVLLVVARLMRHRVRPTAAELWVITISGVLMWVGGNGGVNWAEQRVDSGLAALIVGTMPMWVSLAEAVLDRRAPTPLLMASIVTGFVGLVLLTFPLLEHGLSGDMLGVAAVIGATFAWGGGTIVLSRRPVTLDSRVVAGWQQLAGALGFAAFALVVHEPWPTPTPTAWGAWIYLVIAGSIFAFSSYIAALKLLPTPVVMTYTYVNPVIAVFLGWFVLSEPISAPMMLGMAFILAGVWGVFRDRSRKPLPGPDGP